MNEELKIVIKAITDEAKKNIQQVKKELENVGKEGDKSGKSLKQVMASVGKSVAVAVASVAALTAAMAALGRKAQEVSKGFEKLNTTFKSAGSTVGEAQDSYRELFGILGEHDRAIETAQSLARITTEADKLSEYYDILAGSVAKYGDGLNSEAFSEQIAETIASGKAMGDLARVLVEAGISEDAFNATLAQTASLEEREVYVRNTLNAILGATGKLYRQTNQATEEYNISQANLNIALAQTAAYTTPLLSALNNLSSAFLTVFSPALRTISLYLTAFIQLIAEAIAWVGNFFGIFSSKADKTTADVKGYENAMKNYTNSLNKGFSASGKGIDSNIQKLKELKKQTMGFDELNVLSSPIDTSSSGGGGGSGGGVNIPTAPSPTDFGIGGMDIDFTDFKADLEEAKEKLKVILSLVGLVAAGFALWKIGDFLTKLYDSYKIVKGLKGIDLAANWNSLSQAEVESITHLEKIKAAMIKIGGYIAVIVGAMLLIKGYTDAWVNGVDWGSLIEMISGLALVVGGLSLLFPGVITQITLFGTALNLTAANIALFVGGIALMVVGVKDFIDNGPTLENTILVIGGAIAVAVALATGGLSVLTSLIIGAVAAVVAFTAAVLLQKPAIMEVDEAEAKHLETINALISAENGYVSAMDKAEQTQKRLTEAEKAAGITGEELYNQVKNGNLTYAEMNDKQKELYKAYLANYEAQQAVEEATLTLTEAKKAETIASFENQLALAKESGNYDDYKKSVVEAFEKGQLSAEEARDLIEKSMSEMSTSAQETFMEDIPDSIKDGLNPDKYETIKKKMGDWFEKAGEWISDKFGKYFTKDYWTEKFSGIKQAAKDMINSLIETVERGINRMIEKLNTIRISLPDWDILGSLAGKSWGVNINPISIPRLAKGGIVNSATYAMIGENGKEAVMPLENNTGWMDILASRLAQQINTPSKVVLTVDGRELGWATINTINGITKQTGALQLKF